MFGSSRAAHRRKGHNVGQARRLVKVAGRKTTTLVPYCYTCGKYLK